MTEEKQSEERPKFVLEVQSARHALPTNFKFTDALRKLREELEEEAAKTAQENENGQSNT